jgi:hypothetical protein
MTDYPFIPTETPRAPRPDLFDLLAEHEARTPYVFGGHDAWHVAGHYTRLMDEDGRDNR